MSRAPVQNFAVEVVTKGDGWTSSLLEAIQRPGSSPVSLASISSVHWGDGGAIGLEPVAQALRARGAAFLVDATQSAGVLPLDVASIDPDFVVFPTYKWLLGPYGRAFLYIAKRHQGGVPLEQTSFGRLSVNAERIPYFADLTYRPDARRFDMGERDYLITLEMASIGMEMMADWGSEVVSARLRLLTDRAAEGLGDCPGIEIPKSRAPNILSIAFRDGVDTSFVETLASRGVHVAKRLGRVRISPHIYNDEADIDRFVSIVVSLMTSRGYPSSKPRLRQNLES